MVVVFAGIAYSHGPPAAAGGPYPEHDEDWCHLHVLGESLWRRWRTAGTEAEARSGANGGLGRHRGLLHGRVIGHG